MENRNESLAMPENGDIESVDKIEKINQIKRALGEYLRVDWNSYAEFLKDTHLNEGDKAELVGLAYKYMEKAFGHGHFEILEGAEAFLASLGINSLEFTQSHKEKILSLYEKYSLQFLISMHPSLINDEYARGKKYEKIGYVRMLLEKMGAPDTELTDEYIQELWSVREILLRLHNNRNFDPKSLTGEMGLLEFAEKLN